MDPYKAYISISDGLLSSKFDLHSVQQYKYLFPQKQKAKIGSDYSTRYDIKTSVPQEQMFN